MAKASDHYKSRLYKDEYTFKAEGVYGYMKQLESKDDGHWYLDEDAKFHFFKESQVRRVKRRKS